MDELQSRCFAANVGVRHELNDTRILIASLGHELRDADQAPAFIATQACSACIESA